MEGEVIKRYNFYEETITKQKQETDKIILTLNQLSDDY
jgi:hypothetical protein